MGCDIMPQYTNFIKENVAIKGAKRIGIYDGNGNRVGQIPLGNLAEPDGEKLYSFGALSDVHIVYNTAESDFRAALTYLNNDIDVAFTCICGDLTDNGTEAQLQQYKEVVDECSSDTPVYAIAGNHEHYESVSSSYLEKYTGHPLVYSFSHGNDMFLMIGCYKHATDGAFTQEMLQQIYEFLEENRNKRCFIFEHVFPTKNDSGNAGGIYLTRVKDIFGDGTADPADNGDTDSGKGAIFQSMLRHYKNTVLFHGHSHLKFDLQEIDKKANYNDSLGYRSIHIPALSITRDYVEQDTGSTLKNVQADSEGYVVDVYENGIFLRGRDFAKNDYKGEFIPIATYWIDTTLQDIEEGTFIDTTNTIDTTYTTFA